MSELSPEQAKAYIEAESWLLQEIQNNTYPVTREATRARLKGDLRILQEQYSEEELARALYGDDYQ